MITGTSAAIVNIKAAMDLAKAIAGLKTATDINIAVIDIQRALLVAQSAAFEDRELQATQQTRIAELERELSNKHIWEGEKSRYKLSETSTGSLVYSLRPESANGDPFHRLCVKCFDENRKSVLQVTARHSGGEVVKCNHCKDDMLLSPFPEVKLDLDGLNPYL